MRLSTASKTIPRAMPPRPSASLRTYATILFPFCGLPIAQSLASSLAYTIPIAAGHGMYWTITASTSPAVMPKRLLTVPMIT
ncbi:hypothetical protein EVG20_g10514 [Dentipellis fragilis]|uniref:Uncharacterized protein n=1 Tax=Dentipellis fragilis TaxID=205917 RepID=A0A4Y9XR11_9AGAM|nr:hypothetical protein EVG20_g10514 [Dentipellis fragilis]